MITKRVAINGWILKDKQIDGIGNFTIHTSIHLAKMNPENEYLILCDWRYNDIFFDDIKNIKIKRIFPIWRHPILYVFILDTILPLVLKLYKIDLFIGTDGMISLITGKKQISVIHDLNFLHYPEFLPFRNRAFYNIYYPLYAKKATKIATVSEFSKNDIIESYKIKPEKINVVYCAAKETFHKISEIEKSNIRNKYTKGAPFFVCIGTIHPRKNISLTLDAFELFLKTQKKPFKMILIGNFLWNNDKLLEKINTGILKECVIVAGRLSDNETNEVLASAEALIFMSLFEGFGIPILEAFATETPVICSNTTSLEEISSDAALKADPLDKNEILEKMCIIQENKNNIKSELINAGKKRLKYFSWEKTSIILSHQINQVV
ncbi:MAG: glycosyltransferase family 4 protein [Chitinophagaceae bacterium]